jgi:hypothetical protein
MAQELSAKSERGGDRAGSGSRNGHCPTTVKTSAGPVTVDRPKLRGTDEAFASLLLRSGCVAPRHITIAA